VKGNAGSRRRSVYHLIYVGRGNTDICKKRNERAAALLPLAFRGTLQHILRPHLLKRVIAAINYFTEIHTLFSCMHAHSYRPNFRIAPLCGSISCHDQIKIIYFPHRRQMNIAQQTNIISFLHIARMMFTPAMLVPHFSQTTLQARCKLLHHASSKRNISLSFIEQPSLARDDSIHAFWNTLRLILTESSAEGPSARARARERGVSTKLMLLFY